MDQKTIDTYNELAKEYDMETLDFWDRFPRTIIDKFTELTKGKVLDVGSGSGRDGLILKKSRVGNRMSRRIRSDGKTFTRARSYINYWRLQFHAISR